MSRGYQKNFGVPTSQTLSGLAFQERLHQQPRSPLVLLTASKFTIFAGAGLWGGHSQPVVAQQASCVLDKGVRYLFDRDSES
ncbi:MAG: hypothetical protein ACM65M_24760 [Microcoleus sp.]